MKPQEKCIIEAILIEVGLESLHEDVNQTKPKPVKVIKISR